MSAHGRASFAAPAGYAPASVCAGPAETPRDDCSHRLLAWLPRADPARERPAVQAPAAADAPVRLAVVTPEEGTRVWRNPESPLAADRLVLRAQTTPHVPQIVWYVDGAPFALTDPDTPVPWPLRAGEHRFQIGLPLRAERSRAVKLVVQ